MNDQLVLNHVNTDGLAKDDTASTSTSMVISSSDGKRSFINYLGANAHFVENDINYNIVKNSKIVFDAGTMLMPSFDGEQCALYLKKCKEIGKVTALDTAWDSKGWWMKVLAPSMPYLDYFLPSYEEAVELSGKTESEDIADVFLIMGPSTIAIKLGKNGCFIKSKTGKKITIPTFDRIKPIDTNGAGDSFCAGFLTGIAKGWSLYDCGRFANAVGTHWIMQVGASTGIKSEAEIIRFMVDYENGLI